MKKNFISIDELLDENAILRATITELNCRIKNLKEGFEGCCTACEPVAEMNIELRQRIAELEQKENK
jgi:hypothetical protein